MGQHSQFGTGRAAEVRGRVGRGGGGRDSVSGGSGRDRINCGSGRDSVTADRIDRVSRNCERVRRR